MANRHNRTAKLPTATTMKSDDNQILIAVLGVTGAGKSTFINRVSGGNLEVGHSIMSCTQQVACVPVFIDGVKVVLIDTPGFDDTDRTDADVLAEIARWLSDTYQHGMLLNGIILLQPVDGNRAYGSEKRRTRLFRQICGTDSFSHVVIGTTMWSKLKDKSDGNRRVQERRNSGDFWASLVKHDAEIIEHHDTKESALNIIRKLMYKGKTALQLQKELSENNGSLFETTAAQQLYQDLGQLSATENGKLNEIYREMKLLRQSNEKLREMNEKYHQEIEELKDKLRAFDKQKSVLETKRVKVGNSPPEWIQAVAAIGTVAVGATAIIVPLAAGGACTVM